MYRINLIILLILPSYFTIAQRMVSEDQAVELILKNSGSVGASDLLVERNKRLQKNSFNLPNPELIAESPTGEFYAVGILQSVEFPGVYVNQQKLRKQTTVLSEKQRLLTHAEVAQFARLAYLNLQYEEAVSELLQQQDSLYRQIANTAARQFEAGTIDFLAKTFAEAQASEIHIQYYESKQTVEALRNRLKIYAGIKETLTIVPLQRLSINQLGLDSLTYDNNPTFQFYKQQEIVNQKNLSVERSKAMPGLVFGYLNQGARSTDTYYRFRVGVTLPVWFWQYSGNIKAAKADAKIAEQETRAQIQNLSAAMELATSDFKKYNATLDYYESKLLTQAANIITTARRLFENGQNDYTTLLRNTNEGFLIRTKYFEALRNYNQSIITINYLNGKL